MRLTAALFVLTWALVVDISAQTLISTSYVASVGASVPDDNPNGLTSTIQASGISGAIESVSISLDLTNGYNGDYYAYLTGPGNFTAILLNRVGEGTGNLFGYADSGFHVTLSSGANNIHFYQNGAYSLDGAGALTGTWAADARNLNPESSAGLFDAAPTTAGLDTLVGTQPNGNWTFFIADLSGGSQGTLLDWQLNIVTAVPEPTPLPLMALAALVSFACLRRRRASHSASLNSSGLSGF